LESFFASMVGGKGSEEWANEQAPAARGFFRKKLPNHEGKLNKSESGLHFFFSEILSSCLPGLVFFSSRILAVGQVGFFQQPEILLHTLLCFENLHLESWHADDPGLKLHNSLWGAFPEGKKGEEWADEQTLQLDIPLTHLYVCASEMKNSPFMYVLISLSVIRKSSDLAVVSWRWVVQDTITSPTRSRQHQAT